MFQNLDESPVDDDEDKIPPWEENDGYYGLLSRLVKTAAPDFIWSVRASYDTSTLNKDQMVNHYSRNGCFTTKVISIKCLIQKFKNELITIYIQVGLCSSLRSLPWFYSGCADEFYPRCYKLTHEDDKVAFIGSIFFNNHIIERKSIIFNFRRLSSNIMCSFSQAHSKSM